MSVKSSVLWPSMPIDGVIMQSIQEIRTAAESFYRNGQWLCSEAVLTVINDALGGPMPPHVAKLASGFPVGIGCAGCTCGALTGGVMALGLACGRSEPGTDNAKILALSKELHDWFKKEYGSTCCRVLVKNVKFGETDHVEQCTSITGSVAECVAELIGKACPNG